MADRIAACQPRDHGLRRPRQSMVNNRIVRVWTQTFASPVQSASSKASGATSDFFRQIFNFRSIAAENEQLKQRLTADAERTS